MWFPDVAWVTELHERILADSPPDVAPVRGILQPGALAAAIERARWGPFERGDLAERAALLLRGICQDHPFTDGNKRTAFHAADAFLRRNGSLLIADPADVVAFMLAVARGERDLRAIASWVRAHAGKV